MNSQDMSIYWNQRKGQYETNNFYNEQQSPFTITADRRLKYMEEVIPEETEEMNETSVSIGGWLGTMILMLLPGINIIAILAMAFGAKNENKKAFARAVVLVTLLAITITLVGMALTCNKFDYSALFEEIASFAKVLINKVKA